MKRTIPLLITALSGLVLIVAFFIPYMESAGESAAIWFDILASIAFILGGGNLLAVQLQKISDRRPGWGYAAITIVAFLSMLSFGLLKVGSPPEYNVEFFGESFVEYPPAALPEYAIAGSIPSRADGGQLPKSVRGQLAQENGRVLFRGWMTLDQKRDLLDYQDTLEWQCLVEQLADVAQPPEALKGKLFYHPSQRVLAFSGWMSDEQHEAMKKLLADSPLGTSAVEKLTAAARKATSLNVGTIPSGFRIPAEEKRRITLEGTNLSVLGPISVDLREKLAKTWAHFEPARPRSTEQKQELLSQIQNAEPELNQDQQEAFNKFFEADWKAEQLIQFINSAGAPSQTEKTSCDFLRERESNEQRDEETQEPVLLNQTQEAAVNRFVSNPEMTPEQLVDELAANGDLSDSQRSAVFSFLNQLPTWGEQKRTLCMQLLALGPLSQEQRELLLHEGQEQFVWRQKIGQLFLAAHQIKYPWSGNYTASGTPFWWLYDYVMQPLLTTTFAMLAFYVASAAFRAFRAKNLEAVLLLGTAFIILLGRTFAGYLLTAWIPDEFSALKIDQMTIYIMSIFNTAGNRAIMIGIALGIASTSLKVLLGIDRSYLGRGE